MGCGSVDSAPIRPSSARSIRLTGVPHTVIGVMPRGFLLPPIFGARLIGADYVIKEADFWIPIKLDGLPAAARRPACCSCSAV